MFPTAVILVLLVLALLSVTGAGTFPWTLQTAAILLPVAALLALAKSKPKFHPYQLTCPLVLLFPYLILMLMPLPNGPHRLSPIRHHANQIAQAAVAQTSTHVNVAPQDRWFTLSRNQTGTIRFLLLCTAGCSAWLILTFASTKSRLRWLVALLAIGTATAVAGIIGKWFIPQGDTLFWYLPVPHGRPGPMGGFTNRNHFAGFLAILAPAALCLTTIHVTHKRIFPALGAFCMTTILALGTLFSLSRGGTIALLAGIFATTISLMLHMPLKHNLGILLVSLLLTASGALTIWHVPTIRTRLTNWDEAAIHETVNVRITAWHDTLAVARAYPILGAGPNALRTVFPQHRLSSERAARDYSENEYVQWLAETGLAGLLLALAVAGAIVRKIWQYLRSSERPPSNSLAPAAIGALTAAATHALVDFPLRMPLYAITLAALAALLWPEPTPHRRANASLVLTITLGLTLVMAILSLPANLNLDASGTITAATPATTMRALYAAPTYPIVWRRLSAILWEKAAPDARQHALAMLTQAAYYDQNNYVLWRALGERRQAFGDNAGANEAYQRVRELRDWVKVPYLPEEP